MLCLSARSIKSNTTKVTRPVCGSTWASRIQAVLLAETVWFRKTSSTSSRSADSCRACRPRRRTSTKRMSVKWNPGNLREGADDKARRPRSKDRRIGAVRGTCVRLCRGSDRDALLAAMGIAPAGSPASGHDARPQRAAYDNGDFHAVVRSGALRANFQSEDSWKERKR